MMKSMGCPTCSKTVYFNERIEVNKRTYHKICFKCKGHGCRLTLANFYDHNGELFCSKHVPKLQAILSFKP
ncbi:hypothetical protein BD560DRAFT_395269 [Blakeslea trispora]|nr:hypothetical protein BD560DRAFT_395269 [Blakeslea trispora]